MNIEQKKSNMEVRVSKLISIRRNGEFKMVKVNEDTYAVDLEKDLE